MSSTEEIAKATQEVAKTSRIALEVVQKLGSFTARVIGEPVEITVGILSDRLRFLRWERQLRLYDRWHQIITDRKIDLTKARIAPKLALPIIENASLEEDDFLQDIWARLLATGMEGKDGVTIRAAFIEIVKQLESRDARVLSEIHRLYLKALDIRVNSQLAALKNLTFPPTEIYVSKTDILNVSEIESRGYEEIMDNLFRLRLCAPFIINGEFTTAENGRPGTRQLSTIFQYDPICITTFGLSFIKACME